MFAHLLLWLLTLPQAGWTAACPAATPEQERLTEAVAKGDVSAVTTYLDSGADVDKIWRDSRSPMLCQSLLLRSMYTGQNALFHLLLARGADPLKLPEGSLAIPVGAGNVDMARTLFARGVPPGDAFTLVNEALKIRDHARTIPMLQLLMKSGVRVDASTVPPYFLTDSVDLVRFLVPKHIKPNDQVGLGLSQCAVQEVFGLLSKDQDGCEGTPGPLWLHFVVTGRHRMVEFMIAQGADLTRRSEVWDNSRMRPFTAMDVAVRRKDKLMIAVLRRAGATARAYQ